MTPRWQRGAALAISAAGVLLLLTTFGFVVADRAVNQRTALLLIAGAALLAVYVAVDPGVLRAAMRNRRARPGALAVLASAAVVGVLVAVNVVASRAPQAADLTRSGLYTLSPRSVQATRQLASDLVVTGFFRSDQLQTRRDVQTLLDLYRQQSPRVRVRLADLDQEAGLAAGLGVKVPGSLVLQYRGRPPVVLDPAQQSESDMTGAIVRLESTRSPTVCWASGDGERDLHDANEVSGYSAVAELLRTTNYRALDVQVGPPGVPSTCDVLVLMQLGRPLSDAAVQAVQAYLAGGGKLLLALDPWVDTHVLASANALLEPYGTAFDGGLVVEPDTAHAATDDSTVPVVYSYGASPITGDLDGRYVFLPQATPLTGQAPPDVTSVDLATTTGRAYAIPQQRTDLSLRSTDRPGPFVLLRSLERGSTRIVVSGTSALAENRTMPPAASGSNPDLMLAALDWLSEQEGLMAIAPKPPRARSLALSTAALRWNVALTVALLPLLVVAAGVLVRARRRRRT